MINFLNLLLGVIVNINCFIFVAVQFNQNCLDVFRQQNELAHQFSECQDLQRAYFCFILGLFFVKNDDEVEEIVEFVEVPILGFYIAVDFLIYGQQISMNIRHTIHQLFHNLLLLELQNIEIKMNVIDSIHFFITHFLNRILLTFFLLFLLYRGFPLLLHSEFHRWNNFLIFFLNCFRHLYEGCSWLWRCFLIAR